MKLHILFKKLLTLLFLLFSLIAGFSSAKSTQDVFPTEQWFIQLAAFTSIENVANYQHKIQNELNKIYGLEREFSNYVSIHPRGEGYRALLGPYPTRQNAEKVQADFEKVFSNTMLVKLKVDTYYNYEYNYQFTWYEIDEKSYQNFLKESLVQFDESKPINRGLGNFGSLIAQANQIPHFEHDRYWNYPKSKVPFGDDLDSWPPRLSGNPHAKK